MAGPSCCRAGPVPSQTWTSLLHCTSCGNQRARILKLWGRWQNAALKRLHKSCVSAGLARPVGYTKDAPPNQTAVRRLAALYLRLKYRGLPAAVETAGLDTATAGQAHCKAPLQLQGHVGPVTEVLLDADTRLVSCSEALLLLQEMWAQPLRPCWTQMPCQATL